MDPLNPAHDGFDVTITIAIRYHLCIQIMVAQSQHALWEGKVPFSLQGVWLPVLVAWCR